MNHGKKPISLLKKKLISGSMSYGGGGSGGLSGSGSSSGA